MFENIAEAIKNKDYQNAKELIQHLRKEDPENPWLDFYTAHLYEIKGKINEAKNAYTYLLKDTINPKLMSKIRQGIERINQVEKQEKEQALIKFKSQAGAEEMGVFILESVLKEDKTIAAQNFGKIMGMDAYSARLQIPSRSWRLYRIGMMGELSYYVNSLKAVNIPCFCLPINQINQLSVYQVQYIESINSEVTVICENSEGKEGKFRFNWLEVSQRVEGLVPIFENSFKFNAKREIYYKKEILDYAQFCDLHFPHRNTILRICDQSYNFKKGINLINSNNAHNLLNKEVTIRKKWSNFLQFINQQIPNIPLLSEFTFFGETALDFKEFLSEITPHIYLFRQEPTLWDQAFHLYSSLIFLRFVVGL